MIGFKGTIAINICDISGLPIDYNKLNFIDENDLFKERIYVDPSFIKGTEHGKALRVDQATLKEMDEKYKNDKKNLLR